MDESKLEIINLCLLGLPLQLLLSLCPQLQMCQRPLLAALLLFLASGKRMSFPMFWWSCIRLMAQET